MSLFGSWFVGTRVSGKLAKSQLPADSGGLVAPLSRGTNSTDRDDLYSMKQRRLFAEQRKYSAIRAHTRLRCRLRTVISAGYCSARTLPPLCTLG